MIGAAFSCRIHHTTGCKFFGTKSTRQNVLCTGWFTQSDEPHCRKEYSYTFNPQNSSYVEWHEREIRGTALKYQTSLVYAARPYLDGVNVTERRNLVYNFRYAKSFSP